LNLRLLPVFLLLGLVYSGCSPVPRRIEETPAYTLAYDLRLKHLRLLDHWALDGRLAISDGKEGGSGSFSWAQDDRMTRISFRGTLGKGAWQLRSDASGARLELASGEVHYAPSIAELVRKQVGWKVPVNALSWWIKGLADPKDWETRTLDEEGRLRSLRQFGWEVDFANYGEPDNFWLPAKLVARRGDYSVKMVVRNWRLGRGVTALD